MRCKTRWIVAAVLVLSGAVGGCKRADDSQNSAVVQTAAAPDPEVGAMLYAHGCMTCHGATGQGMLHQGAELRKNQFIATKTDAELIAFLKKGRLAKDPDNKTGVPMPAGGTIPGFGDDPQSDTQTLGDVVAFLRQMQLKEKQHEAAVAARHAATQSISAATQPVTGKQ